MSISSQQWLLCPPEFFDVRYEINPWMNVQSAPDRERAARQWKSLEQTFLKLKVRLQLVHAEHDWPDMVFTANAGLVRGTICVLSRFRFPERQGEEPLFQAWFEQHGFSVVKVHSGFFEGEGDALFVGDTLVGGYGFRSDRPVYDEIGAIFGLSSVIPVRLTNSYFYHLDTCFCPLNEKSALIFPGAFDVADIAVLERSMELIAVPEHEARRFACNAVVLEKDIILPAGCGDTCRLLEQRGFTTHPVELDEYMKAGGAAKCLSLRVR